MPSLDEIWSTSGGSPSGKSLDDIWGSTEKAAASAANFVGKNIASPLGRALDAQRWAVAKKLTGETDPDKQRAAYRAKVPGLPEVYQGAANFGIPGHAAQGIVDLGIDTATDPLTLETALAGPAIKGVGALGRALGPIAKAALKRAPEAVQTAVKDAGQIGKAARGGITRITAPGGKEAGDLQNARGRGARDILLGASGKHALNEEEMKRAFLTRFDKTIEGLAPEEETNVYKALNGERGAQGLNPKEAEAFSGLRKLADEAAYSEANPGLRWAISLRQGGLRGGQRGRTFKAKAPELEPLDPALVPEQQKLIAEDKIVRGGGNARLSRALYPLGREVKRQPKSAESLLHENAPVRPRSGEFSNPLEDETFGRPPRRLWRNVRRTDVQPLEVSPDIAEFIGPGGRRDAYKWRYLPGYNERAAEESADREAFEINPLNWENPNLKEREDFRVDPEKLQEQREAFRQMLGNAARESATASLQRELPERGLPIGPLVENALQRRVRAKGAARTGDAKLADAYKGLLQYGRAAQVSLTPYHIANIMALQAAHAPTTIPEAIATTARALGRGANRHEIFREGRELGALAPSIERQPLWAKTPLAARAALGAGTGGTAGFAEGDKNTPLPERLEHAGLGALAGAAAGGLVPAWSKGMNNLVFTYDDAAKQALARNYSRHGMTRPYQAGRQAAEDLVDYANPSSLGNALSFVSKFPTYRSQLPFAALRGIAKNPARFEALNRATQGVLSGGTAQTPFGPVKSYASTADVGRGDPWSYARSTFADPVKIGLSTVVKIREKILGLPKDKRSYYFTYGLDPNDKRVLLSAAAAGLPEARSVLDEVGLGEFKQNPGSSKLPIPVREGLFDVLGLSVGR